jgi:hypothetical protein
MVTLVSAAAAVESRHAPNKITTVRIATSSLGEAEV